MCDLSRWFFFFFNDTATTEIYTLSLHDALPIWRHERRGVPPYRRRHHGTEPETRCERCTRLYLYPRSRREKRQQDRKSTRLNSSHANISYAVFCLKKKKCKRRKSLKNTGNLYHT